MKNIPKTDNGNYSWVEYRKLVLHELSTLAVDVEKIKDEQVKIKLDIREIKTRSVIWGGISGFVVGTIITIAGWVFF